MPFATIPLKQMENKAVSLEELYGKDGNLLETEILKAAATQDKIAVIESFLENRLMSTDTIDRIVKLTVETMLKIKGQLSVNQLSEQLQVNRKQLERKFSSVIGLSPKQLSKIIRLQATLKLMQDNGQNSLTAVAYQNEYYDQAHFIKDFKEFTGLTPKKFYGDNLKMTSIFYGKE
jgi:AraC-like DNA-binding protein